MLPVRDIGGKVKDVSVELGELAAAAQLTGVWTEDCADQFRATGKRLNESLNVWLVRRVRLWRRSRLGGGKPVVGLSSRSEFCQPDSNLLTTSCRLLIARVPTRSSAPNC